VAAAARRRDVMLSPGSPLSDIYKERPKLPLRRLEHALKAVKSLLPGGILSAHMSEAERKSKKESDEWTDLNTIVEILS
jgi:hypothetical protein